MKKLSKANLPNPELKLIQDNSEIHCYHCGGKKYIKNGLKNGIQQYKQAKALQKAS